MGHEAGGRRTERPKDGGPDAGAPFAMVSLMGDIPVGGDVPVGVERLRTFVAEAASGVAVAGIG